LSFALERIGTLAAITIIVFYLFILYLLALPNTPENPFASIYSESLIKPLVNTFCSSLGLTLLFIESTTIHPLYLWVINRDPTRHSSKVLTAVAVAQKANRIAEVKLPASWAWGLRPYDRNNPVAEVRSSDLTSISLILWHR
jgi:hypothetical protein